MKNMRNTALLAAILLGGVLASDLTFANVAMEEAVHSSEWVTLNSVCVTNAASDSMALRVCQMDAQAVNLLSNDKIVFQASCGLQEAGEQCNGYLLRVKAFIVKEK